MSNAQAARIMGPDLFTPLSLRPYVMPNRIVMAPLTRNRAGPGNVPQAMDALYYAQRASAGLIITEPRPRRSHPRAWVIRTRLGSTTRRRWKAGGR
jgi:2,4-dienoyl-CoA reductase-like NADH-dependent reductase (Old Yellow Enzyme family)